VAHTDSLPRDRRRSGECAKHLQQNQDDGQFSIGPTTAHLRSGVVSLISLPACTYFESFGQFAFAFCNRDSESFSHNSRVSRAGSR
jgi:hypothetical protein